MNKLEWKDLNEVERRYIFDDHTIVVKNSAAVCYTDIGEILSNANDTERIQINDSYYALVIVKNSSEDWVYPPPRFPNKSEGDNSAVCKAINRLTKLPCINGPWATPDLFKDGE